MLMSSVAYMASLALKLQTRLHHGRLSASVGLRCQRTHQGGLNAADDLLAHGVKDRAALTLGELPDTVCHRASHPRLLVLTWRRAGA